MEISAEAFDYIEHNWIEVDDDTLTEFVREALERPGEGAFWDDELYVTHTLAFHTPAWNLTNDYILEQANYRAALEILEPLGAEAATIGHWTYSTFECIKVPVLDDDGKITPAGVALWDLSMTLNEYPLLSEEIYFDLECEVNDEAMTDAIRSVERERGIEFTDDQKWVITELYWNRYLGMHETGYIPDDEFLDVVDAVLTGNYQQHQEDKLW